MATKTAAAQPIIGTFWDPRLNALVFERGISEAPVFVDPSLTPGLMDLADGSSTAPSLSFESNPGLGLWRIGSDNAGFSGSLTIRGTWDPVASLDDVNTTPETHRLLSGRLSDLDKTGTPGNYQWGLIGYEVNTGTTPVTGVYARAAAHSAFALNSTAIGYGSGPQVHGIEIQVGAAASEATVTTTSGSAVLTSVVPTVDGSRFEAGMAIAGTGIPGGTTILSVAGRPGAPTSITMSANATATGSGVAVTAQPTGTIETIGLLVTGFRGTATGGGNPAGQAIHIQAYEAESSFKTGLSLGPTSLLPTGTGVRLATVTAARGLSFESSNFTDQPIRISGGSATNAILFSTGTYSSSVISYSTVTATNGIFFSSSNVLSGVAIRVDGHDIAVSGGTPATSGRIRLGSTDTISARNAADSANIVIATLNASDKVEIRSGALVVGTSFVEIGSTPAGTGQLRLPNATSIGWRNAADSANMTLTVDSANAFVFNGSVQTSGASLSFTALTPATVGRIRLGNTDTIQARNAANSANRQMLTLDSSDIVQLGSASAATQVHGSAIGFFGVTPTARATAYTPTNVTTDRAFDADTVVVAELADVVGTLIADLKLYGLLQS